MQSLGQRLQNEKVNEREAMARVNSLSEYVRNLEEESKYVFFATRNGTVKKTELKDFSHVMSRGIIAINIEKGDELVAATLTDGQQIIFLASHEGQAIRFEEDAVRPMGRNATGVRGMNLEEKDYIVGMATTPKPGATTPGPAGAKVQPVEGTAAISEGVKPEDF